jgi:hypothetical protein
VRKVPALQVEQVKTGGFEAIYEDNVWKMKPDSNDQKRKSVVEFLFLCSHRMPFASLRRVKSMLVIPFRKLDHVGSCPAKKHIRFDWFARVQRT